MDIVFAWNRPPPPWFIGGAEISQEMLAVSLARLGHNVLYIGSTSVPWDTTGRVEGERDAMEVLRESKHLRTINRGHKYFHNGINCQVVPSEDIEHLVAKLPVGCLVITSQEHAASVIRSTSSNNRTLLWLHSTGQSGIDGLRAKPNAVLATSRYVRDFAARRSPASTLPITVFYPPFDRPAPETEKVPRDIDVLMVNPIPSKGVDIFLRLAEVRPDLRFAAVEGWWDSSHTYKFSSRSNVTYIPKTDDLSSILRRSKVLLVPSAAPEGFGRVAVEAALHGCVPIVSGVAGLTEAVPDVRHQVIGPDSEQWRVKLQAMLNVDEEQRLAITQATSRQFIRDYATEFLDIVRSSHRNGF